MSVLENVFIVRLLSQSEIFLIIFFFLLFLLLLIVCIYREVLKIIIYTVQSFVVKRQGALNNIDSCSSFKNLDTNCRILIMKHIDEIPIAIT